MHITASVFINDDEAGLHHDYDEWLDDEADRTARAGEPVPAKRYGRDNADAHIKRRIMGRKAAVAVTEGRLDFCTWEQIFYQEFDGRRRQRVLVKISGE